MGVIRRHVTATRSRRERSTIGLVLAAAIALGARPARAQQAADPASPAQNQPSGTSNNRLFGTIPDFLTVDNAPNIPPLTPRQKLDVTTRSNFDIGQLLYGLGLAAASQIQNADPSLGRGASGFGKRFALEFADITVENYLTTAILPVWLHQDPRYFRLGRGNPWHRLGYALSRIVVTRGDAATPQFNVSEIGGAAAAAGLYNLYHPASDRTLANTLESCGLQIGFDAGFIVMREFWPDVRRAFGFSRRTARSDR
jgi:hypothetical protein